MLASQGARQSPGARKLEPPALVAQELRQYLSNRLRAGNLDLYSAFLLAVDVARIERISYRQPACPQKLSISGLLGLYMLGLTAAALKLDRPTKQIREWFIEDSNLLYENRKHFLTSKPGAGATLFDDHTFWKMLSDLRRDYDTLSDDDGPYPNEVFPWNDAAPERELLEPGSEPIFGDAQVLDSEVSEIFVELASGQWA